MEAGSFHITGRVQGVGFRYFTRRRARSLNLSGWVRNNQDGSVEVWAEGNPDELKSLEELLKKGPSGSRVERVEFKKSTPTGKYVNFEVTF